MAVLVGPGKHMARTYRDGAKRTTRQRCKPCPTLLLGTDSHPDIHYFVDPAVVISVVVGVDLAPPSSSKPASIRSVLAFGVTTSVASRWPTSKDVISNIPSCSGGASHHIRRYRIPHPST